MKFEKKIDAVIEFINIKEAVQKGKFLYPHLSAAWLKTIKVNSTRV